MAGAQRRQHLIDVALRLFATRGFSGTTTHSIAEAAGISEGIIFRHFRSKEELYDAILEHKAHAEGLDRIVGVLRRHARRNDDERLIQTLAQAILDSYQRDADFRRLMLYAALEGHDLAKAAHRTFGGPMFSFLREYVVSRQKAGVFREGNPEIAAFALIALPVYFSVVNWLFRAELVAHVDQSMAEEFARITLDGLRLDVSGAARQSTRSAAHRASKIAKAPADRVELSAPPARPKEGLRRIEVRR